MKRKIPLTNEQREHRDRFIKLVYKETTLSLEMIGGIFGMSKQLVSKVLKQRKA